MNTPPKNVAWIFSGMFLISFLIALVPNPIVGTNGIFQTNLLHDLVHLITAIGFAIVASRGNKASTWFMKGFGIVYLGVALLGFLFIGDMSDIKLLGMVHINVADNFLHLGFAAIIITMGFLSTDPAHA